jgi:FixJ family two-component response regulator
VPHKPLVAIVDDDESVRHATQNLLAAAGFSTTTFPDGASFLGSSRRRRVSCLVTDMRMPGMSGLELCETLVASGNAIPTVLMTAYPDETIGLRAREAGVLCCLNKPFSPERLCECIRSALAARPIPRS